MDELRKMEFPLHRLRHDESGMVRDGRSLTAEAEEILRFEAEACCPSEGWDENA